MKKKFKGNVKGDVEDIVVPGLEWMSKLGESAQRDYKAEYKKFQSSPKAKKYRAELNKYNRQKGTYGNGDGKDASHKGGKIVGFESQSKNRGRAEKSRLKKEINDYVGSIIDETLNENPAAIAAAQRMVVQSKGKKISVNTARQASYKEKDPSAHNKAKSMWSRLLDRFRKKNESINEGGMELKKLEDAIKMFKKKIEKQGRVTNARDEEHLERLMKVYNDMGGRKIKENSESLNWLQEKCWKGYEKKGMKTMFGKRYPNCVKKKKSESVNEQSKVIKSIDNLAKKNKYGTVTGTRMNGKTANTIMKIYNHPKMKSRQKDLDKFTSDELVNLTISRDIIRILGLNESINEFKTIYSKNKAAMKIRSLQRDKNAKVYKVDKKRTKYQGKDLIVYNLLTKNKNHSTNQNPYGLDMMKGAYLIPVEENIKKDSGLDHNQVMTKFISDAMKKAGIRIIKVDMMKKGRFAAPEGDQWYGAFFTVASSNMTDMPGQGKVKRSSAVLPVYIDKKNQIELGVSGKGFKLGKVGSSQVLKNLKDFKKSDLEESINENISDSQKFKIYNSLKKGDIVSIKYDSSIGKGSKFHPFLVTKGKTKLMKGRVERIIMVPASGSKAKRYLYNRGGRISLALGDMAASIVDMKKGKVNEGSCGYGVDGKLGEEPAGPHLIKKKKKKIKEDIEMSKGVKKLMKIADEGFGKVGGTTVDSMSASLFKQIYNKVNDDIKKQLNTKNEKQLVRIIAGMWKKFGKNVKIGSSL